jgi:hypothetical protein
MKKGKILKLPLIGRFAIVPDRHGAGELAGETGFTTNLSIKVFDKDGNERKVRDYFGSGLLQKTWYSLLYRNKTELDLGSGLITNIAVAAIANEAVTLASPSGSRINTLFLSNFHASGTGVTAAAATDFKIQTISTQGGQTPVSGTQTIDTSSTIAVPKYKTVATITYTGAEAVTEWGLFTNGTLSTTTGTPFTSTSATTFTATATPFTASSSTVQGLQQQIVVAGTTTVLGLISTNTTSVGTLFNNGTTGWFTQAAQTAGSTPGTTEAYTLRPIMWDHKVFSAVNVANGDSIQFTYTAQVNSGG